MEHIIRQLENLSTKLLILSSNGKPPEKGVFFG